MRGTHPPLPLTVNTRLAQIVTDQSRKGKIPSSFKRRLLIIEDGIQGKSKYSTRKKLGISKTKINLWRGRWKENISMLIEASEQGLGGEALKDYELLKMIKDILSDRPRMGAPKSFTLEEEEQIVALACDNPQDHGIEMTNWTHEMLAHVSMAENIVTSISKRHIGNILKKRVKTT